MNLLDQ